MRFGIARCDPGEHRVMFEWQTATGQNPTAWENQPTTNSASATFAGYPPGTWVNVRARVHAGAGDWSSVIQIMVV